MKSIFLISSFMVIAFFVVYIPEILQTYAIFSSTSFTLLTFFDFIIHSKLSFGMKYRG